MAKRKRIRPHDTRSEETGSEGVKNSASLAAPTPRRFRRLRVALILATIAGLGWGGQQLWESVSPQVIHRDRYLLSAEAITATDQPEWITGDVLSQVVKNAGLDRRISIVDNSFIEEIQNAFALHPWVESVGKIEKSYPPAIHVELTYRRPVAAVETTVRDSRLGVAGNSVLLLPVDRHGIHLPAEDVPGVGLRYLPRIMGIVGQPPQGQRWDDPRVAGAVDLAERLTADWERLYLSEILPSPRPEINGPRQYFLYDLITRGGTRIVWGAAPRDNPPGESDFQEKLQRLNRCVRRTGPLDSVRGPKIVDVRNGERIVARTAKKEKSSEDAKITK
ncbi:cell division protein FtsQ/DivIB [Adhaeretor mobilis]|uniref:Cell division protein FtsQ n=1 Tax=Adhaeretor mobilis TaxID=1930276 RepID=A0A517MUT2_9BACT|nr:hypothetical protein [Adhaeretor mobilis]QDS98644.1 hypothetical protein HG15A2_19250 [Adhaeretor mobilis]